MKLKRTFLAILLILIIALGAILFWSYRELHAPVSHARADEYIEVPKGSTPDEIISSLASQGVIRRGWLLRLYLRLSGAGPRLQAGEYRVPSPISALGDVRKREEGQQRLSRLTTVAGGPGWGHAPPHAPAPD